MDTGQIVAVLVIGAAVGFLGGLFGKGGSAIATPLLSAIGIPAIAAVASPLPAAIPGTLAATYAYWEERLIDWRVARWSIVFGVPATIAGALATKWIGGQPLVVATEIIVAALGLRFLVHPSDPHEHLGTPSFFRTRLAQLRSRDLRRLLRRLALRLLHRDLLRDVRELGLELLGVGPLDVNLRFLRRSSGWLRGDNRRQESQREPNHEVADRYSTADASVTGQRSEIRETNANAILACSAPHTRLG